MFLLTFKSEIKCDLHIEFLFNVYYFLNYCFGWFVVMEEKFNLKIKVTDCSYLDLPSFKVLSASVLYLY